MKSKYAQPRCRTDLRGPQAQWTPPRRFFALGLIVLLLGCSSPLPAQQAESRDLAEFEKVLQRPVLATNQTWRELQTYLETKVPVMEPIKSVREWRRDSESIRRRVLDEVVLRGEARNWAAANAQVEWLDTLPGGPGYKITKLRYEAIPGMWIPALLYEPDGLSGRVPVALAVNGHDPHGKAAAYKQLRCINLVKRGMIVLNVDWFAMGQLKGTDWEHYRMNQIDLCGSSGLAPFYLSMKRGIDLLLALDNADPSRVSVSGLSGGAWQTIFISSLDPRVTLANPVAGYSSFRTRIRHPEDLGDSEQTPSDLATIADYTHLTALRAPRPTLLTFNAYDNCCFPAGHAMGPLVAASEPVFRLLGAPNALRTHINFTPGTHNYEQDNREAFYRMLGDFFYRDNAAFQTVEIASESEVKTADQLLVPMPAANKTFHDVALELAASLPRGEAPPDRGPGRERWQSDSRGRLAKILRVPTFDTVTADFGWAAAAGAVSVQSWRLRLNTTWNVPLLECSLADAREPVLFMSDGGRTDPASIAAINRLLAQRKRVFWIDPFYFGDCRLPQRDFLYAMLLAAVGDRPLGLQAAQVAAAARWISKARVADLPVAIHAEGPRMSLIALAAAAMETKAVAGLELKGSMASLREVITNNLGVNERPEWFCFGLLEHFDIPQIAILVEPRPVKGLEAAQRP